MVKNGGGRVVTELSDINFVSADYMFLWSFKWCLLVCENDEDDRKNCGSFMVEYGWWFHGR